MTGVGKDNRYIVSCKVGVLETLTKVPSDINVGYVQIYFKLVGCAVIKGSFVTQHLSWNYFYGELYQQQGFWVTISLAHISEQKNKMWSFSQVLSFGI